MKDVDRNISDHNTASLSHMEQYPVPVISVTPEMASGKPEDKEKSSSGSKGGTMPGYMRTTNSSNNRRMTPVAPKQASVSRSNSVTFNSNRSFNSSQESSSNSTSMKKTSTPLRKGGQKLNFSNASAIAEPPIASVQIPRPVLKPAAGSRVGLNVAAKARINRRQSIAVINLRAPLRAKHVTTANETLSDEIEFDIRRSYLICSLKLLDKFRTARAAVEKKGLQAIWQMHQMIGVYRKDTVALIAKKKQTEALLPYAKQLKVLHDVLSKANLLKSDMESCFKYLAETTERKQSLLAFEHNGMSHEEAVKVLQQSKRILQSPELEKLPILIQGMESYSCLKDKLDQIFANSEKCTQLIKEIEVMTEDDEKYRRFLELMPKLNQFRSSMGTSN